MTDFLVAADVARSHPQGDMMKVFSQSHRWRFDRSSFLLGLAAAVAAACALLGSAVGRLA